MINLIVIVDPNYGDLLETAAKIAPIWIVDSQPNKTACRRMWSARPFGHHRNNAAATCFDVSDSDDRQGNLLNLVPTLMEHHGEIQDDRFVFPKSFVLGVIGLAPSHNVLNALRTFGFSSFIEKSDGFHACT